MELDPDLWAASLAHVPPFEAQQLTLLFGRDAREGLTRLRKGVMLLPRLEQLPTVSALLRRLLPNIEDRYSPSFPDEMTLACQMLEANGPITFAHMSKESLTRDRYQTLLQRFVDLNGDGWKGVGEALGPSYLVGEYRTAEEARLREKRAAEEARWRPPCLTPEVRAYSAACFAERMAKQASRPPRSA